jgi:hypothetical protein
MSDAMVGAFETTGVALNIERQHEVDDRMYPVEHGDME